MRTAREVVQAFFDAFNRHDVDALVALYAEDAVNHQMPTAPLRGREAIRKSFEEAFAAVPDMVPRGLQSVVELRERHVGGNEQPAPEARPRPTSL